MLQPNHLYHLLTTWLPQKDQKAWCLAMVIRTQGSVYRKAGAMMLISESGESLGLVSGGCLEHDLVRQARRVLAFNQPRVAVYDANDEDSMAWQLGIGCGGRSEILLMPLSEENQYLCLPEVLAALACRQPVTYSINWASGSAALVTGVHLTAARNAQADDTSIDVPVHPVTRLLVFGAGLDMQPLVAMAAQLGWQVTVVEPRINHNYPNSFPAAEQFIQASVEQLPVALTQQIDAAVIAQHNLTLDAKALRWLNDSSAKYIGMLGPEHRKREVFSLAGMEAGNCHAHISGPMGLEIGGDLPESIALSTLAEVHRVIHIKAQATLREVVGS